jgi:hypothetical protein
MCHCPAVHRGYRDTADIIALAAAAGLSPLPDTPLPMPANNFMLSFVKQ